MQKEKIKQIYQKLDIVISEEDIDKIMKDTKTVEGLMRIYKEEENESMNYIFGKDRSNLYFTEKELSIASKINLFSREVLELWKRKLMEVKV